jgi:chemotaxis protein CheC
MMMFLLPETVACNLVNMLMYTDIKSYTEINDIGFSAIGEMANIMSGSFIGAITEMTKLFIDISPPASTVDMLGSIMSVPAIYFGQMGDKLMYVKNELEISGKKTPANIMLLPDAESLEKLMASLGIA